MHALSRRKAAKLGVNAPLPLWTTWRTCKRDRKRQSRRWGEPSDLGSTLWQPEVHDPIGMARTPLLLINLRYRSAKGEDKGDNQQVVDVVLRLIVAAPQRHQSRILPASRPPKKKTVQSVPFSSTKEGTNGRGAERGGPRKQKCAVHCPTAT